MKPQDPLKAYQEKRQLGKTPEPPGGGREASATPVFVVRRSRTLHYDFRLEMEGVLQSWAVPKGPSLNPQDKRLAVPTGPSPGVRRLRGDHPGGGVWRRHGHGLGLRHLPEHHREKGGVNPHGGGGGPRPREGLAGGEKTAAVALPSPALKRRRKRPGSW